MSRPYNKKNTAYWARHSSPAPQQIIVQTPPILPRNDQFTPFPEINYGSLEAYGAAESGGAASTLTRARGLNSGLTDAGAFQNIRAIATPFCSSAGGERGGYIGVKDAIDLSVRAWTGFSAAKNAVEVAVEFSCQPLYVKCSNKTVRTFFKEWLNAILINRLKEQFFREYYRSGNIFMYRFDGEFGPAYYQGLQESFGAKENRVPIRYELLNPSNIYVPNGLSFPYTYCRMLSTYEVDRLRNPVTEQDKQVYEDLPDDVKSQIRSYAAFPQGIFIPLDPKRLRYSFYKKQGYEPMAVPMLYPVLPDIEWKLALKKMDMSLARTIEHAILIVTTGEPSNEYNRGNGINPKNIARLQALFENQTIGRVLVADFTTKAQWLIPDIQEILGPEKYAVVNADIKEGLQSILAGDDKFANAQIKAKIFIQRLVEGQDVFLNDFLLPEVRVICEAMGFRTMPKIGFQKINLQDETVMARVYTQMAQLGLLTGDELNTALDTGVLPDPHEAEEHQKAYKDAREDGLYEPLIGGKEDPEGGMGPNGRPAGTKKIKQSTKKISPIGTGSDAFSTKAYIEYLKAADQLETGVYNALKTRFGVKKLNNPQQAVAQALTKTIMAVQPPEQWITSIASTLEVPPAISEDIAAEIDQISLEYQVDSFDATILRLCRRDPPESHTEIV